MNDEDIKSGKVFGDGHIKQYNLISDEYEVMTNKTQWRTQQRYHFAGLAMQGLMTATFNYKREWTGQFTPSFVAEQSVKMADELLAELEKDKS